MKQALKKMTRRDSCTFDVHNEIFLAETNGAIIVGISVLYPITSIILRVFGIYSQLFNKTFNYLKNINLLVSRRTFEIPLKSKNALCSHLNDVLNMYWRNYGH